MNKEEIQTRIKVYNQYYWTVLVGGLMMSVYMWVFLFPNFASFNGSSESIKIGIIFFIIELIFSFGFIKLSLGILKQINPAKNFIRSIIILQLFWFTIICAIIANKKINRAINEFIKQSP